LFGDAVLISSVSAAKLVFGEKRALNVAVIEAYGGTGGKREGAVVYGIYTCARPCIVKIFSIDECNGVVTQTSA